MFTMISETRFGGFGSETFALEMLATWIFGLGTRSKTYEPIRTGDVFIWNKLTVYEIKKQVGVAYIGT